MVEGWKKSPEHRKNMLDPDVTQAGVGIAHDEKGRYYGVQMFGRPKDAVCRPLGITIGSFSARPGDGATYVVGDGLEVTVQR